jgi:hypothetical protein
LKPIAKHGWGEAQMPGPKFIRLVEFTCKHATRFQAAAKLKPKTSCHSGFYLNARRRNKLLTSFDHICAPAYALKYLLTPFTSVQPIPFSKNIHQPATMLDRLPFEILDIVCGLIYTDNSDSLDKRWQALCSIALACQSTHLTACRWLYRSIEFNFHGLDKQPTRFDCFVRTLKEEEEKEKEEKKKRAKAKTKAESPPSTRQTGSLAAAIHCVKLIVARGDDVKIAQQLDCVFRRIKNIRKLHIEVQSSWSDAVDVNSGNYVQFPHLQQLFIVAPTIMVPPLLFRQPSLRQITAHAANIFEDNESSSEAPTVSAVSTQVGDGSPLQPRQPLASLVLVGSIPKGATISDIVTEPSGIEEFGIMRGLSGTLPASPPAVIGFLKPVCSTLKRLDLHLSMTPLDSVEPSFGDFCVLEYLSVEEKDLWLQGTSRADIQRKLPSSLRHLRIRYGISPFLDVRDGKCISPKAEIACERLLDLLALKDSDTFPHLDSITLKETNGSTHSVEMFHYSHLPFAVWKAAKASSVQVRSYFLVPGCIAFKSFVPCGDCHIHCLLNGKSASMYNGLQDVILPS